MRDKSIKNPYSKIYYEIIEKAHKSGASDIHIEPQISSLNIRFRIHGTLITVKRIKNEYKIGFINTVKRLSNLSIAISGKEQDSRVNFSNLHLDARVNLLPTLFGEKVVLRLLDQRRSFDIGNLEIDESTKEYLKKTVNYREGLILISGPTGSGKTTTLYTLLNMIDRTSKNITTVENPVEYTFDGINQVDIKKKITFSSALRGILRQDPDVILVGEIRDQETAKICFHAAATGHLVLSSIHANSAVEVLNRLKQFDISEYDFKNIILSGSQRLVQVPCSNCSIDVTLEQINKFNNLALKHNTNYISNNKSLKTKGNYSDCTNKNCFSGITKRIPIIEYVDNIQILDYIESDYKTIPNIQNSLLSQRIKLCGEGKAYIDDLY